MITYRKGKYRDWQRRVFKEVTVEVCGRKVKYLLGERLLPMLVERAVRVNDGLIRACVASSSHTASRP